MTTMSQRVSGPLGGRVASDLKDDLHAIICLDACA
jgi:hypothetical protein